MEPRKKPEIEKNVTLVSWLGGPKSQGGNPPGGWEGGLSEIAPQLGSGEGVESEEKAKAREGGRK